MSAWMQSKERWRAARRRRRPAEGNALYIPFEGQSPLIPPEVETPGELFIEPTGMDGETALWLDDFFWLEMIRRWPQRPLTIHFQPTRKGLLHPVVLHQLTMLRRVAPEWRLIGHCYRTDLTDERQINQAALSLYHEIYVRDMGRPGLKNQQFPTLATILQRAAQIQAAARRTSPLIAMEPELDADLEAAAALDDAIALESARAVPASV